MLATPAPPYAVMPVAFRFPALAALAGRLPLGAGREVVLAVLLAARVAASAVDQFPLQATQRAARAAAVRQWLPSLCPDTRVRNACTALADASAGERLDTMARALTRVMEVTSPYLDRASRAELAELGRQFAADKAGE